MRQWTAAQSTGPPAGILPPTRQQHPGTDPAIYHENSNQIPRLRPQRVLDPHRPPSHSIVVLPEFNLGTSTKTKF